MGQVSWIEVKGAAPWTFAASRDLNPLTKRKTETKVKVTLDGEVQAEPSDDSWDPRGWPQGHSLSLCVAAVW